MKQKQIALGGLLLFFTIAGCDDKTSYSPEYVEASQASHHRMQLELLQVLKRTDFDNPFIGNGDVLKEKQRLARLRPDTPGHIRGYVMSQLGWAELRYGSESDAIKHLVEARRLFNTTQEGRNSKLLRTAEGTLAMAYLRLAETQNCCAKPNPESCIFPLRGEAIHNQREGAEKALPLLTRLAIGADVSPEEGAEPSWLANIAMMVLGDSSTELPEAMRIPEKRLQEEPNGFPEFRNIAEQAGIATFGLSGGAVMDDFDGDGFYDLLVSQWDTARSTDYFRNKGDGTFEKLSKAANLSTTLGGLNMKQADFDNDGDLDVYIMRGAWMGSKGKHPNSLLRNDGVDKETGAVIFTDVTFAVGLGNEHYPCQTGDWADFDLDGDLDLFVGNEGKGSEHYPCQLFRNDGPNEKGIHRFTDIAKEAGVEAFAFVKGAVWGDYDADGYPDLFLSCIHELNHLYHNKGDGTFENVTVAKGVEKQKVSFPAWFWDFNNDGHLDLFVSAYRGVPLEVFRYHKGYDTDPESVARLFQNNGAGGFDEVSEQVGLTMTMLPMGSNFGDVMNDGFPDMYLGTGNPSYSSIVPNIFISNEQGLFVDHTLSSRLGHLQKGHAVSFADFDRDGDLDIFEQMGGAYRGDPYYDSLYENPGENGNNWLSVRLKGVKSNSFGVGSRVRVVVLEKDEKERSIYQWMNSGGSFGANPLELHFGLGKAERIARIEIFWPRTGKTQVLNKVRANRRIVVTEE